MHLNHPETIPPTTHPGWWKTLSSIKLVPGVKKVGDWCPTSHQNLPPWILSPKYLPLTLFPPALSLPLLPGTFTSGLKPPSSPPSHCLSSCLHWPILHAEARVTFTSRHMAFFQFPWRPNSPDQVTQYVSFHTEVYYIQRPLCFWLFPLIFPILYPVALLSNGGQCPLTSPS